MTEFTVVNDKEYTRLKALEEFFENFVNLIERSEKREYLYLVDKYDLAEIVNKVSPEISDDLINS